MADVYRLTGDLPDDADPYPTPDLRGKSKEESAARLARMLGRDASEAPLEAWVELASFFAELQLSELVEAARGADTPRGAGARCAGDRGGLRTFSRAAPRLGARHRPYRDFAEMIALRGRQRARWPHAARPPSPSPSSRRRQTFRSCEVSPPGRCCCRISSGFGATTASCPLQAVGACATQSDSSKATRTWSARSTIWLPSRASATRR